MRLIINSAQTLHRDECTPFIPSLLFLLMLALTLLAYLTVILAGIQRACLPPLLLCLVAVPFLCHPFFNLGNSGYLGMLPSGQQPVVLPLSRHKPNAALVLYLNFALPLRRDHQGLAICMHTVQSFSSLIWSAASGKFLLPLHPNFDAHVSRSLCQAFLSSLCFAQVPQMQGKPTTVIFLPQPRVASTSRFAFGKILFLSWSPWKTIGHATLQLTAPGAT